MFVQTRTQGEKIDDDDGHYIVVPDAQLGDRCKPVPPISWYLQSLLLITVRPSTSATGSRNIRQSCRGLRHALKDEMCYKNHSVCAKVSRCITNRATGSLNAIS